MTEYFLIQSGTTSMPAILDKFTYLQDALVRLQYHADLYEELGARVETLDNGRALEVLHKDGARTYINLQACVFSN